MPPVRASTPRPAPPAPRPSRPRTPFRAVAPDGRSSLVKLRRLMPAINRPTLALAGLAAAGFIAGVAGPAHAASAAPATAPVAHSVSTAPATAAHAGVP